MPKKHIEQNIQSAIMDYIKSIGGLPIKQNQIGIYAQAGVPDIIACIEGKFVAIEVKQPGKTPPPLQLKWLDAINKAGGYAFWADNLKDVKEYIKRAIYND